MWLQAVVDVGRDARVVVLPGSVDGVLVLDRVAAARGGVAVLHQVGVPPAVTGQMGVGEGPAGRPGVGREAAGIDRGAGLVVAGTLADHGEPVLADLGHPGLDLWEVRGRLQRRGDRGVVPGVRAVGADVLGDGEQACGPARHRPAVGAHILVAPRDAGLDGTDDGLGVPDDQLQGDAADQGAQGVVVVVHRARAQQRVELAVRALGVGEEMGVDRGEEVTDPAVDAGELVDVLGLARRLVAEVVVDAAQDALLGADVVVLQVGLEGLLELVERVGAGPAGEAEDEVDDGKAAGDDGAQRRRQEGRDGHPGSDELADGCKAPVVGSHERGGSSLRDARLLVEGRRRLGHRAGSDVNDQVGERVLLGDSRGLSDQDHGPCRHPLLSGREAGHLVPGERPPQREQDRIDRLTKGCGLGHHSRLFDWVQRREHRSGRRHVEERRAPSASRVPTICPGTQRCKHWRSRPGASAREPDHRVEVPFSEAGLLRARWSHCLPEIWSRPALATLGVRGPGREGAWSITGGARWS